MKRRFVLAMIIFVLAALCLPFAAFAIVQPPSGADYGMGSRATVFYNGKYYGQQTVYLGPDINPLTVQIYEDTGWEIKYNDVAYSLTGQFRFMNGKIYNIDFPNGADEYDWLMTEEEFIFEKGRYEAFCKQLPQAVTDDFIAFVDFSAWESTEEWYTAGMRTAIREGYFIGSKGKNAEFPDRDAYYLRPEAAMTRAEVVTTIMRTAFPKIREYSSAYSDVKQGAWYYDYIVRAYEAGLIEGARGPFNPNDPASREFTAQMLSKVMQTAGIEGPLEFIDTDTISPECIEGVRALCVNGIIEGYPDDTFRPRDTVTRAEYGVMLARIIESGLMSADTVNEAFAREYTKQFFEELSTAEERISYHKYEAYNPDGTYRIFVPDIQYPFYG